MRTLAALSVLCALAVFAVYPGLGSGLSGSAHHDDNGSRLNSVALDELKQKHAPFDVSCADCHGADLTFAEVPPMSQCLVCHESYDAVAELTEGLTPNPHHSHMGEVTCTDCHSEHYESQLSCNQCHIFEMTVP